LLQIEIILNHHFKHFVEEIIQTTVKISLFIKCLELVKENLKQNNNRELDSFCDFREFRHKEDTELTKLFSNRRVSDALDSFDD